MNLFIEFGFRSSINLLRIAGNALNGTIASEIGQLQQLKRIDLREYKGLSEN